jgi:hypothetical protein
MSAFDNVFNSVYGLIDYSDFKSIYLKLEEKENVFRKIHFIAKRMDFVSRLHRADVLFCAELIIYLLLTCFDILGENKEWINFDNWLNSDEKEDEKERSNIFSKIDNNKKLLQNIKYIRSEYNKIYGVRTSFNNFIDNILPVEARFRLLDSIQEVKNTSKDGVVDILSNRANNKKLLFEIRNSYTHRGIGIPSGMTNDHSSLPCWSIYIGLFGIYSHLQFYNWPSILFYAVKEGFVAYIEKMGQMTDTIRNKEHLSLHVEDFILSSFKEWKVEYLSSLTADSLLRQIASAFNSQCSKREIRSAGYGFDWVIKDVKTNQILTDLTIKRGDESGPLLKEYDIPPNSILKVIDIQDKLNFSENHLHVKRKLSNGSYLYATYEDKSLIEFGDEKDKRFFRVEEFQEVTYE